MFRCSAVMRVCKKARCLTSFYSSHHTTSIHIERHIVPTFKWYPLRRGLEEKGTLMYRSYMPRFANFINRVCRPNRRSGAHAKPKPAARDPPDSTKYILNSRTVGPLFCKVDCFMNLRIFGVISHASQILYLCNSRPSVYGNEKRRQNNVTSLRKENELWDKNPLME